MSSKLEEFLKIPSRKFFFFARPLRLNFCYFSQITFETHFINVSAADMLKFSICFIAFISHVNNSISSREKRFLIFPRANPTRHQVAKSFFRVIANRIIQANVVVHRWNRNSRRSRAGVADHRLCAESAIFPSSQRVAT